jgi:hypothetical protein
VAESLGDRLVRKEFADIGRAEFERDEAIQAIGREVAGDRALYSQLPEPSPGRVNEGMHDMRTGLPSEGPVLDQQMLETNRLIDRTAKYFDDLDRAELVKRHREAFPVEDSGGGEE